MKNPISTLQFFEGDIDFHFYIVQQGEVQIFTKNKSGQRVDVRLLPNIQWEVMYKLDYFSTYPAVYFFAMFLKELFEKDFSIYIIRTVQIFVVLISIIVSFRIAKNTPTVAINSKFAPSLFL